MIKRWGKNGDKWRVDVGTGADRARRVFPSEAQAKAWEERALRQLEAGKSLDELDTGESWTMARLCETVTAQFWAGSKNEYYATRNADEVVRMLGPQRHPNTVTALDIDALIETWKKPKVGPDKKERKGNSAGTINRKLAALSKMMNYAESRNIIGKAPHIDRKPESKGRLRWYTPEEELKALAEAETRVGHHFADFLVFLADTGCRLGEALACRVEDADGMHARFYETKNGEARSVPLTRRVRERLKRRPAPPSGTSLLWWDIDEYTVRSGWDRVREACGLKDDPQAVLHTWRHTCASRLVQAGTPITVVKEWLGHKTLSMTLRYAHLAPSNLLQAVQSLERATDEVEPVVRLSRQPQAAV